MWTSPSNRKPAAATPVAIPLAIILMLSTLLVAMPAAASDSADGEILYVRHCAHCHDAGEGHPGTMRLAKRLGAARAVLLERDDLPAAYVTQVVRHGLQMMPPFRISEIDDAELAALAAFLATGGGTD